VLLLLLLLLLLVLVLVLVLVVVGRLRGEVVARVRMLRGLARHALLLRPRRAALPLQKLHWKVPQRRVQRGKRGQQQKQQKQQQQQQEREREQGKQLLPSQCQGVPWRSAVAAAAVARVRPPPLVAPPTGSLRHPAPQRC